VRKVSLCVKLSKSTTAWPKTTRPVLNYHKTVLNINKACQQVQISSSN